MAYPVSHLAVFGILALGASAADIWRRRIPNWITVPLAATGALAQYAAGGVSATASGVAAALVVGAILVVAWKRRIVGGGDVKLAAAAAVWVGLRRAPDFLVASVVVEGILAAVCFLLSSRDARAAMWANATRLHPPDLPTASRGPGRTVLVPCGAAFVAGAALTLLQQRGGVA